MHHTQTSAARELFTAIVVQAMEDLDDEFVLSDVAAAYLALCGFDDLAIFRTRLRWCLGLVDARRLDARRLHAPRIPFANKRARAAAESVSWATWGGATLGR